MPKKKRKIKRIQKAMRKRQPISLLTKLLLISGIILIILPAFFTINERIQLAFFTPHVVPIHKQLPLPSWISIPSVAIELPIQETQLHGNTWEIADYAISHLAISARPGEDGPIILYGHNTNDRFGPIRWLHTGEIIELKTTKNKTYTYKIVKTVEVNPNQVDVLVNQKGQTLILYTCSGFADLKRFVIIAKPQ